MSCPKGEYYCRTSGKCKSIPAGHKVTADGDLIKEDKKKSYSDIITKNASEFGDTLNKSKQVKKFKNSVEDFGKTGKIDIKSLVNNNKNLPDFLAGLLALPYLAKKFLSPTVDRLLNQGRKTKIGGDTRSGVTEEVQGGVNVETYTDGIQFNEIETIDIIKTKPLDPSNWRSELINTNTGH